MRIDSYFLIMESVTVDDSELTRLDPSISAPACGPRSRLPRVPGESRASILAYTTTSGNRAGAEWDKAESKMVSNRVEFAAFHDHGFSTTAYSSLT